MCSKIRYDGYCIIFFRNETGLDYSEGHIRYAGSRQDSRPDQRRRPVPRGVLWVAPTPVLRKHTLILKFLTHWALVLFRKESMRWFLGRKRKWEAAWTLFMQTSLRVLFFFNVFWYFAYHFKRAYQNFWFCFGSTALLARTFWYEQEEGSISSVE